MTNLIELTALWERKNKNGELYFTGKLGKMNLLIMKNKFKKEEKHPDWIVYVGESSKDNFYHKNDNTFTQGFGNESPF